MSNKIFRSEKEMEDVFCNYIKNDHFKKFIGRQIHTVTGRLDVLAYCTHGDNFNYYELEVYELKNRKIKYKDIAQVLLYKHEIVKTILAKFGKGQAMNEYIYEYFSWFVSPHLVGTGYTKKTQRTINALQDNLIILTVQQTDDSLKVVPENLGFLRPGHIKIPPKSIYEDITKEAIKWIKGSFGSIKNLEKARREEFERKMFSKKD